VAKFLLTNKNIRLRFRLEQADRKARRLGHFGLSELGSKFGAHKRTAYFWTTKVKDLQHLPTGERAEKIKAWLNDGRMEKWIKEGVSK
jgi:hypothetical protein